MKNTQYTITSGSFPFVYLVFFVVTPRADVSNSRSKGPLGRKRDEEAIWENLPETRTNRTSCRKVTCRGKPPMFTKVDSAQPYIYRLFAATGNCCADVSPQARYEQPDLQGSSAVHSGFGS
jgi:hypothetical protein